MNNLIKAIGLMQMSSAGLNRQSAFNEAKALALTLILQHTEGKVLVPVEPTDEMIQAARDSIGDSCSKRPVPDNFTITGTMYKAMLEKAK